MKISKVSTRVSNRVSFRMINLFILFVLLVSFSTQVFAASAPYRTLSIDNNGNGFITKDGYLPLKTIEKIGDFDLKDPSDLAFSTDGFLFIADTGNARVLKATKDGDLVAEIGVGILGQPRGIYVNNNNELYVADVKNKKVFLFDDMGNLLKEYTKPEDVLYGKNNDFKPSKVTSDNAGNVYIVSDGNTNGIIQLSKEGDFFGYIGANKAPLLLREILQRLTFTSDQKAQLKLNVPVSPNNVAIDRRGLVYTTTQGGAGDGLKKFNMAGKNMFANVYAEELVTDVCVGKIDNIFTVSHDGYICEYTSEGEMLFYFGGQDDGYNRNGLFVSAVAIALDSEGMLYVLDSERKNITIFETTEYVHTVHTALELFQAGQYIDSKEPWENALRQDALLDRAYRGIGEAQYKLENYDEAMSAFKLGYDYNGFSNSFWEIRNEFMTKNLVYIIIGLFLLWLLYKSIKVADKKNQFTTTSKNWCTATWSS